MEKRILGGIQEAVSLLGFGAMRFPLIEEGSKEVDRVRANEMLDYAIAHGVNYFDTAYPYHETKSENILGEFLKKHPRDSYFLADKLPIWLVKSEADVERLFDEQREKCQVEYFDFYLVHALDAERLEWMNKLHIYENLLEKKREGKIRYLGFSFHDKPAVLQQILEGRDWDFAQIQLNYLDWELQDAAAQYDILEKAGIPCVVMEPVRGGALATLCDEAKQIFRESRPDKSAASWAIRYAASLPNVLTLLSGMSNMEQVEDNIKTLAEFEPLTEEDRIQIEKALQAYRKSGTISCTGCRYCMDCPAGVDIPKVISIYNTYCINKHTFGFDTTYRLMGEEHQAHQCVRCGACMEHCPQNLQIPNLMETIAKEAIEIKKLL